MCFEMATWRTNHVRRDGVPKLTDFGLSVLCDPEVKLKSTGGSLAYLAPEIIRRAASKASTVDVWCLGIVLFAMVAGRLPFESESRDDLLKRIVRCDFVMPESLSLQLQGTTVLHR